MNSDKRHQFERRQASLDVQGGIIGALVKLKSAGHEELYLLADDGWYVLEAVISRIRQNKTSLSSNKVRVGGFFVLVSGASSISVIIYPTAQLNVNCLMDMRKVLVDLLYTEKVPILFFSVFIG